MSKGITPDRLVFCGHGPSRAMVLTVLATLLGSSASRAGAPKDAAAVKLAEEAINTDYLATNFAEAEKKLRNAAALCGTTSCSPRVRARVMRDLGVVLIAGLGRADDGKKAFVEALKADPDVRLEKALTTREIEQIFRAARGGDSAPAATPGAAPAAAPAAAGGDMAHTPAAEQMALTSVPIYVELPEGIAAVRVIARYKPYGMSEWKTLELRRLGPGYGGEVPCNDVGSTTGDFIYFVQATDAAGDVVSTSGSRAAPNKVPIKNALTGEPPHLPGLAPPIKCKDSADCPPGLPGCPSGKVPAGKGWGASCEQDGECNQGLWCKSGACDNGDKPNPVAEKSSSPKAWLSLHIGQDVSFVPSQPNVCGTQQQLPPAQYTCIDQDGYAYKGIPQPGGPGAGNTVNSGMHLATTRIMAGFDYLVAGNVTLGVRLGYVFGGAPAHALSAVHGETRIAFWFGKEPFARQSIRPYLVVAGGLAAIDDKLEVPISETDATKSPYATQTLTAWRHGGVAFAGGGGGLMIPIGTRQGVLAELKIQAVFPDVGIAMAPSIGYALGL